MGLLIVLLALGLIAIFILRAKQKHDANVRRLAPDQAPEADNPSPSVPVQEIPIKNGALIVQTLGTKVYTLTVTPQASRGYDFEAAKAIAIRVVGSSFDAIPEVVSAVLTGWKNYDRVSEKLFQCGHWNAGNKYKVSIDSFERGAPAPEDLAEAVDGDAALVKAEETSRSYAETKREEQATEPPAPPPAPKEIRRFDKVVSQPLGAGEYSIFKIPRDLRVDLPTVTKNPVRQIGSTKMDNVYYEVNLEEMVCGCKSFIDEKRYLYETADPRRYCRHLGELLAWGKRVGVVFPTVPTQLLSVMLASGIHKNLDRHQLSSGLEFYLSYDPAATDWVDVFTRKKKMGEKGGNFTGDYERYGYNITEKRWSYGDGPAGAAEIKAFLR